MARNIQLVIAGDDHDGGVGIAAEEAQVVGYPEGKKAEAAHDEEQAAVVRAEEFTEALFKAPLHPLLAIGDAGLH